MSLLVNLTKVEVCSRALMGTSGSFNFVRFPGCGSEDNDHKKELACPTFSSIPGNSLVVLFVSSRFEKSFIVEVISVGSGAVARSGWPLVTAHRSLRRLARSAFSRHVVEYDFTPVFQGRVKHI